MCPIIKITCKIYVANKKLINPPWVNPRTQAFFAADNPDNPIGERWIGLEGIEEDLSQLNEGGRHYTLKIENKKNRFKVTLNYRSDLLIRGKFDPESVENYFS